MIIPTMIQDKMVDEKGYLTNSWRSVIEQLLQNMQQCLSQMGTVIATQSNDNMLVIQNKKNPDDSYIVQNGTLIFNSSIVNGGTTDAPNGQLYIRLADNTFHPITNT